MAVAGQSTCLPFLSDFMFRCAIINMPKYLNSYDSVKQRQVGINGLLLCHSILYGLSLETNKQTLQLVYSLT